MNPRIVKDIRLIAPAWVLTLALMIAATFLPQVGKEWAVTVVVFGSLIIAGSIFGAEFGHGTMPQFLAQPIDRRRLWRDKTLIMAAALASLFVALAVTEQTSWPWVIIATAFCTIPYFTLLGRSTISGIILAVPIPGLIFLIGGLLALWLLRPLYEINLDRPVNEERLHFWVRTYMYTVLPAYCALVFYLGYRRFLNFEVVGRQAAQVRLPASMLSCFERLAGNILPQGHFRSLVAKELHLQHSSTILFLVFVAIQLLAIAYIKLARPSDPDLYFSIPVFLYAAVMPLLIGSSAIAEETNLGTRAGTLTLPVSLHTQWFIKLAVVTIFTIVLAIAIPLCWLGIGSALGLRVFDVDSPINWVILCAPALPVAFVAFYASSFSRDTLRALLAAFGLCASILFCVVLLMTAVERNLLGLGFPEHLRDMEFSRFGLLEVLWIVFGLPVGCLLFLALRGSFKHFATLDGTGIWLNLGSVVLSPILLLCLLLILAFLKL